MKTFSHLWRYLAKFFSEWEMTCTRVVQKIRTHILCSIHLSENRTLYETMSKTVVETQGLQMTSQYGAYTFYAGKARLHVRMRMTKTTRLVTQHGRTHARTHRPVSNTYCFPAATMIRERASMLRYTYIVCLVHLYVHRYKCYWDGIYGNTQWKKSQMRLSLVVYANIKSVFKCDAA
jgi:hypothetical protein